MSRRPVLVLLAAVALPLGAQTPPVLRVDSPRPGGALTRASESDPKSTTRLLRQPTLSATHIAFTYANNVWVV